MKYVIVGGSFQTGYYFFDNNFRVGTRDQMMIYDTYEEVHDNASWINHRKHSVCVVPLDELDEYLSTDYDK